MPTYSTAGGKLGSLLPFPKLYQNGKVGDIVLFRKTEGAIAGHYKYGAVEEVRVGTDGRIRAVVLRYRNPTEGVERTTVRAVRTLVVIHRVDELDVMEELGKATL